LRRKTTLRKVGIFFATVLVFGAGLSLSLVAAQAASPAATLGVYRGAANPSGVSAFAQWLGSPVSYAEDFLPGDSWSSIEAPTWTLNGWKGTSYRMVYGVPIIPDTGGTLAEGASGTYNAYSRRWPRTSSPPVRVTRFSAWAGSSAAVGTTGTLRTRPTPPTTPPTGDRSSQRCAQSHRTWPSTGTRSGAGSPSIPRSAYPGDAYVDYIGIDVYDQSWCTNYSDPAARWNDALNAQWALPGTATSRLRMVSRCRSPNGVSRLAATGMAAEMLPTSFRR